MKPPGTPGPVELGGPNPQAGETAAGKGSDRRAPEGRTSTGQPCVRIFTDVPTNAKKSWMRS